jgi:F-type H+-transporting ATPase subunit b
MPQFDFSTYSGQIFWLFVSFFIFVIAMVRFVLPRFRRIIQQRDNHIEQLEKQLNQYELELKTLKNRFAQELNDANEHAKNHFSSVLESVKKKHQEQMDDLLASNKHQFEQFENEMTRLKTNIVEMVTKDLPSIQEQFFQRFH